MEVISWHFHGGTEEEHKEPQLGYLVSYPKYKSGVLSVVQRFLTKGPWKDFKGSMSLDEKK
jgi:hypothetical protein